MSEISKMSGLPKGWISITLGEVSEFVTSGSRNWSKYYSDEGALFVRTQDIKYNRLAATDIPRVKLPEKVEGKRTRIHKGDLLVTITGYIGRVAAIDDEVEEAYVSQSVALVRLRNPEYSKFIQHQLLEKRGGATQLEAMAYGLGRPVLNLDNIRNVRIAIAPIEQQKHIVSEIEKQFSRLDEAVAELKRVKANLRRYKVSVFKAAVEGRLVETEAELARGERRSYETGSQLMQRILKNRRSQWSGRGKYKEPAGLDPADYPELPEGWCWIAVEAIAFVTKLAGFEYTKFVKYSPNGDLAVVKAENAGRDGFKRTMFSRVKSEDVSQLTRSRLIAGDILMVFVGAGTGNVARVPDDQRYFLGPNIAMIRVESSDVSAAYLELFLRSPIGKSLALGYVKAVAQPSLSMGTIRMIPVALPPLSEQHRILNEVERRLSVIYATELQVESNLKRAEGLRASTLSRAFFGGEKNACF